MRLVSEIARHIVFFGPRAVKQHPELFIGQFFYRSIERKTVFFGNGGKKRTVPALLLKRFEAVHRDRAARERQRAVGDHAVDRHAAGNAETGAVGAGSRGIVEREHARLKLAEGYPVLLAGICLRKLKLARLLAVPARHGDYQKPFFGKRQRSLHRIRKAGTYIAAHHKTVNDHLDAVAQVFIERYLLVKIVHTAVNAHAGIARFSRVGKHLFVHSFFGAHDGCQHEKALTLRQSHYLVDYLIDRLPRYDLAADRAVCHTHAGVKQTEIVVYFCHRADS